MKKNIVIVVSAMNLGGAQRVVSILCNYWSQNGYKVTLISTYTGNKANHFKIDKGVSLASLNINPIFSKNRLLNLIWKFFQLRKLIKEIKPDAVISFLTRINIASSISTAGLDTSLVICERTWTPFVSLNKRFYWLYRIIFRKAKIITVQTEKSREWLSQNFPDNRVEVIPNPMIYPLPLHRERLIKPSSIILPNRKIILASGRMQKYKGFDYLIKAFSKIKDNHLDWDLVIIGDGEERFALTKLINELKIENRVYLPGSIGNMAEWYEMADLFVLSSILEGFPNVLLEAMSYGLPCISFDCNTGPRDMIEDGVNGILVNPDKGWLGLVHALNKLMLDEELRSKFSQKSILLREKYSIDNVMQKWDRVLDVSYSDKL